MCATVRKDATAYRSKQTALDVVNELCNTGGSVGNRHYRIIRVASLTGKRAGLE